MRLSIGLRPWASVHATGPAAAVVAVVAVASVLFAHTVIEDLGVVRLLTPVSMLLLLPAVAGVGAALACHNAAPLPLPDPPRARLARAGWSLGWTMVALLAANTGRLVGASASWAAIGRNVLLFAGIGILVVGLGFAHLVWLPALGYLVTCMLFGYPYSGRGYYWWAFVMEEEATVGGSSSAGALLAAAMVVYVVAPRRAKSAG